MAKSQKHYSFIDDTTKGVSLRRGPPEVRFLEMVTSVVINGMKSKAEV